MPRALTNKQVAILELLREGGGRELTCQQIADTLRERTPCGSCNGSGEGDDTRYGCRRCFGRGQALIDYSTVYQALKRLQGERYVTRRHLQDEWGDDTRALVYRAAPRAEDDPLEQLWALPEARR